MPKRVCVKKDQVCDKTGKLGKENPGETTRDLKGWSGLFEEWAATLITI